LTTNSLLFVREPKWKEHRRGLQHVIPADIQSWVYEADSLTQRLRDYYHNDVSVNLLFHRWRKPFLSERRQLGLPLYRFELTREVMLHHQGQPLLLARTIIPDETIKVAHRNLAHLGTRPLGEVIFSYPNLERITMDIALVETGNWNPLIQTEVGICGQIWGRRTVYAIMGRAMIVSEFFLPQILNC
jgi:chorismate--pyruvate lyase